MADPDLSLVIQELANRNDVSPICSQTLGLGGNGSSVSAPFNAATSALRIFCSQGLQQRFGSLSYAIGVINQDRPDQLPPHQVTSTGTLPADPPVSGIDTSGQLIIGKPALLDVQAGAGHRLIVFG